MSKSNIPNGLFYTKEHEWILIEGENATVGITDHAQSELGDIVFVELPEVDDSTEEGDTVGTIEAVKTVADIYNPIDGIILEVNATLEDEANIINEDPYGDGWIYKIKINKEATGLMTSEEYKDFIK